MTELVSTQQAFTAGPGRPRSPRGMQPRQSKLHVLATVNAAWNIWSFRCPLIVALLAEGHRVTVLAPDDETARQLEAMGCRFLPLKIDQKGPHPMRDLALLHRLRAAFREHRPHVILSYPVKNNIYGAIAAIAGTAEGEAA